MTRTLAMLGAGLAAALVGLAACGDNVEGIPDEILSADVYAGRCKDPRSGIDPTTRQPYIDVEGSVLDEQLWIRSWTDDTYLWYSEVPKLDIRQYSTPVAYFEDLKTPAKTASGKDKDEFHFDLDTAEWIAMSQSGVEAGYGVQWALLADRPPRSVVVAYVQPGSPAAAVHLDRGAEVITIDGVDVKNGSDLRTLNEGLYPSRLNASHTFVVIDRGSTTSHSVTMSSASIEIVPVQHVGTLPAPNDKVGYFLFTDHIATAQQELVAAISQLKSSGVTELILDMRYNGGGYLAIASELAYMIAGPQPTAGKAFERLRFNDKHPTTDPVTGEALTPEPFLDQTVDLPGAEGEGGQTLPYLGLSRVFVLTSSGTCSASEAVMNGLAGVDVQVIQIGETTCGKPYGFYPEDNCGTTYFSIQFQGVNQKGFGDYADGFVPGGVFRGCTVPDDFSHVLGDPAEGRVAAALGYLRNQTCPPALREQIASRLAAAAGVTLPKRQWRQNAIATRHTGRSTRP